MQRSWSLVQEQWHVHGIFGSRHVQQMLASPDCASCLASHDPCAWCAISQACVPNSQHGTLIPILAPIRNEDICPLGWRERWELRSRPFGCRCSTMTFMSVVVAVLSTMIGIFLIWSMVNLGKWAVRKWRKRGKEWWRVDRIRLKIHRFPGWPNRQALPQEQADDREDTERRPLLG